MARGGGPTPTKTIRMPPPLWEAVAAIAEVEGVSESDAARMLLRLGVDQWHASRADRGTR